MIWVTGDRRLAYYNGDEKAPEMKRFEEILLRVQRIVDWFSYETAQGF
jgi:hypothetical protein